jgi:ABC-type phosphate transport system substrate-binding protein
MRLAIASIRYDSSRPARWYYRTGQSRAALITVPFPDGELPWFGELGPHVHVPLGGIGYSVLTSVANASGATIQGLRLPSTALCRMFTEPGMWWDDPELTAANPALALPHRIVVPIVRRDDSAGNLTLMRHCIEQAPQVWDRYLERARDPLYSQVVDAAMLAGQPVAAWPSLDGASAFGPADAAARVAATPGGVSIVEPASATGPGTAVAAVANASGAFLTPTVDALAAALAHTETDADGWTTVDASDDPAAYSLAAVVRAFVPTSSDRITRATGRGVAALLHLALGEGQDALRAPGYVPLPPDLAASAFAQARRIPGAPADQGGPIPVVAEAALVPLLGLVGLIAAALAVRRRDPQRRRAPV